ncbi:MAG: putative toxin-antitoxin system toxin component, PIN family [Oscillospiraceae bacterium]|nr:putative toxin-antitoxin system toxin component, PIN family [Oscillospiraceae bacterium]
MRRIVVDTNVLISSAISDKGSPAKIMDLVLDGLIKTCYSHQIILEYKEVLSRPKFDFDYKKQQSLIAGIKRSGILIDPDTSTIKIPDESDRVFYDTAYESGSILVTGNIKHYPDKCFIMTPTEYIYNIYNILK